MKMLVLVESNSDLNKAQIAVKEVDIPSPAPGQVLVRMCAAPVNPSDYGKWRSASPDSPMGLEGAGVVVASGGGLAANRLVGRTVGVIARDTGTYAEYVCVDALRGAFPMDGNEVKPEDAASFFVNPYTALAIIDTAESHGCKAFIHTAAASQLGQMMVKRLLSSSSRMTVVNVVRRQEQVKLLRDLGAQHVVCTADEDWKGQLAEWIAELDITVAFDAIAGEMSGTILSLLPSEGTCYVYGGLSKEKVGNVDPVDLIYKKKSVKGFMLINWMQAGGPLRSIMRLRKASKTVNAGLVKGGWAESKFVDCTMEDMQSKFLEMWNAGGFTDKKLRIRMD